MPKAKFEGIYRSIKQKIEAQDFPYQSLLPAESELIAAYGCARNTLRRALAELTADGYLQPIQGKGGAGDLAARGQDRVSDRG